MPIRRRLILLTVVSAVGGALFAPFLIASMSGRTAVPPPSALKLASLLFAGSGVVAAFCSWAGLRFADRAQLPMPLLRAWEEGIARPAGALPAILMPSLAAGLTAGLAIGAVVHVLPVPANPGTLAERLLTVFFAASIPEIVVHLFAMSALVVLLKRRWLAILLTALLFVLLFHSGQAGSAGLTALVISANFLFGALTGWMYARRGFEAAVLTHAVAHLIALGWN